MSEAAAPTGPGFGVGLDPLLSDERLARRAVAGSQRAFAAIFRRHHQGLYRYCLAIVSDPQDAQDALQNTMVKALRSLPGEDRTIELKPWLYRVAHNEAIDLLRARKPHAELDPEAVAVRAGLTEELTSRERLRSLLADLDELPDRQRGALVMRELNGLDYEEIGAVFETSASVARQTTYEARRSLVQMEAGREMECDAVTRALSDADGRVSRRRDLRAHLRQCADCRRFQEEIQGRQRDFAAILPLPAVASAGLLHGLIGGSGGSAGGGGITGVLGGGAAKTAGASLGLKSAAAVAVIAVAGGVAADQGGLFHRGSSTGRAEKQQLDGTLGAGASPRVEMRAAGRGSDGIGLRKSSIGRASGTGVGRRVLGGGRSHGVVSSPEADAVSPATAEPGENAPLPVRAKGRGHQEALPQASAHGQETAAAHKGSSHGEGGVPQPTQPIHPAKPSHPTTPAAQATPGSSGSGEGSEAHGVGAGAGKRAERPPESPEVP